MSETEYERIIEEIKANEIDTNPSDTYINDIPGKLDKIIDDGISFFSMESSFPPWYKNMVVNLCKSLRYSEF